MKPNSLPDLETLIASLRGLPCWYVSVGGVTSPTFQLALGEKIPRQVPLKNPAQSEEYRHHEGEMNLLVWCSWRLDGPDRPLTSSDDSPETIQRELGTLVGASVGSVSVVPPAWDLTIGFSNGLCLRIFCDHLPGDPSFDGNWDLWGRQLTAFVGPGAACSIRPREEDEAEAPQPSA